MFLKRLDHRVYLSLRKLHTRVNSVCVVNREHRVKNTALTLGISDFSGWSLLSWHRSKVHTERRQRVAHSSGDPPRIVHHFPTALAQVLRCHAVVQVPTFQGQLASVSNCFWFGHKFCSVHRETNLPHSSTSCQHSIATTTARRVDASSPAVLRYHRARAKPNHRQPLSGEPTVVCERPRL